MIYRLLSKHRGRYHSLVQFPGHYVYHNDHEKSPYNHICAEEMDISIKNFVKKVSLMLVGGYGCIFSALYASFWRDSKTTTTAVQFPYVDEISDMQFYLNLMLQSLLLYYICFLYFGIETTMSLFENFATISPKLIHLELNECITLYEQNKCSMTELRNAFKNCVLQILDYER